MKYYEAIRAAIEFEQLLRVKYKGEIRVVQPLKIRHTSRSIVVETYQYYGVKRRRFLDKQGFRKLKLFDMEVLDY